HALMTAGIISLFPFDHAAQGETSLMMALCPQGVDMDKFSKDDWYTASATDAHAALGEKGRDLILDHMRQVLGLTSPAASK
ncbi:MAG: hypothetical protein ACC619_01330, partial [Paracoccaceae bacterium]